MSPQAFEASCLALPGASMVIQWGGAHVYKIGPKMFAVAGLRHDGAAASYILKVSEMAFELLIEQGLAQPAPYLARANWVQLGPGALPDEEVRAYLRQAHALVAAKLTRATRRELGLSPT
jgi:predicted DNA-binding protein (MmcQ/YjbR family)